jgi:hypothetical protein
MADENNTVDPSEDNKQSLSAEPETVAEPSDSGSNGDNADGSDDAPEAEATSDNSYSTDEVIDSEPVAASTQDEHPSAPPPLPTGDSDDNEVLVSVGMFLQDEESDEEPDVELPPELTEPSFGDVRKNVISWVILVVMLVGASGSLGWVFYSQSEAAVDKKEQVEALFYGGILDLKTAEQRKLRDKWLIEDTYAKNRYGEFKMMYSPRDAKVTVTQYKFVEPIPGFIDRFVRGGGKGDQRRLLQTKAIQRFQELTTNLDDVVVDKTKTVRQREKQKGERYVVSEQNIKNLPLTQRSNSLDKDGVSDDVVMEQVPADAKGSFWCKGAQKTCLITRQPMRFGASDPLSIKWTSGTALLSATTSNGVDFTGNSTIAKSLIKPDDREIHVEFATGSEPDPGTKILASYQVQPACTMETEEFCTYVYRLTIERELYKPKAYLINSDFSLASPGITADPKKERVFTFEKKGPSVYEVAWPGVDLQPTPELFQLQYIRLMTTKAGNCSSMMDEEMLKAYGELETDEARYLYMKENGFLSLGPPFSKAWTLDEFNAQIKELKNDHPALWSQALEVIAACKCNKGPNSECWKTFRDAKFGAPAGSTSSDEAKEPAPSE